MAFGLGRGVCSTFPAGVPLLCYLAWPRGRLRGHKPFRDIAVQHARTTLKNHFRDDGSSFHVVSYDPKTGAVEEKGTHQGFSAGSPGRGARRGACTATR